MVYTYEYPRPAVTVDIVIFRKKTGVPEVLLIRRKHPPFMGKWAIPGGFVDMEEHIDDAAARELAEETGLAGITLHQFHAFGAIGRDPRHRTITIAYYGFLHNPDTAVKAGDDAAETGWHSLESLPPLAFDHADILAKARETFEKESNI